MYLSIALFSVYSPVLSGLSNINIVVACLLSLVSFLLLPSHLSVPLISSSSVCPVNQESLLFHDVVLSHVLALLAWDCGIALVSCYNYYFQSTFLPHITLVGTPGCLSVFDKLVPQVISIYGGHHFNMPLVPTD